MGDVIAPITIGRWNIAALLMTPSMRPKRATVSRTIRSVDPGSDTSTSTARASFPSSPSARMAASAAGPLRSATPTFAPSAAGPSQ